MSNDDLTAAVRDALDPTPASEADWPVSRRDTLRALAGVGALAVGPGGAQGAAGTGIADAAYFSNYGWESTAEGGVLTIEGAEFVFDGSETVVLPDGGEASTVVLPDGSTASTVVGPDGGVLKESAIPDSGMDHFYWAPALSSVSPWPDEAGSNDATSNGAPSLVSSGINGNQAVGYDGDGDDHLTTSAGSLGASDVYTFAVVFEVRASSGTGSIISNGTTSSTFGGYRFIYDFGRGGWDLQHTGIRGTQGGTADQDPHVAVGTFDGSSIIVDLDGSEIINESFSSPDPPDGQIAFAQRGDDTEYADVLLGAVGHDATSANSTRRDELTDLLAEPFGIAVST